MPIEFNVFQFTFHSDFPDILIPRPPVVIIIKYNCIKVSSGIYPRYNGDNIPLNLGPKYKFKRLNEATNPIYVLV